MTNLTNKLFLPVFMLLLSISPAAAHNDTFFNSPHRLELKPASFAEPGYQLAKSYWLGGADLDLNFKDEDDKTRCNSMGYFQEACQGNKSPLLKCPYNSAYVKCTCDTSIYRYSALNCPPGSYPDEDVCDDYSKGCVCENNKIWSAEDNSCVGCLSDSDCADGKECNNRECVNIDLCAGVNCTGGQSCNAETGQCECPSGEVFYENQCQAPNCTNGEVTCSGSTPVCAANGQCVECVSASDCGANEICSGNTCQTVDRCKDVSCSGGKSCVNGACVCPSGQVDNNGTCEVQCILTPVSCNIGSILYSDRKCYAEKPVCREAIAVVFDTNERLAVGLTEYMTFWGPGIMPPEGVDILDLRNLTDIPAANREEELETFEADGKSNTKIILRHGIMNGIIYGAAQYTQDSAPQGTNKDYDWWLPSAAEIKSLASNYETVNKTLAAVGTPLSYRKEYWLSIEFDPAYAMAYILGFYFTAIPKNIENVAYSRPITSY